MKHDFNQATEEAWIWLWDFLTRSMTVVCKTLSNYSLNQILISRPRANTRAMPALPRICFYSPNLRVPFSDSGDLWWPVKHSARNIGSSTIAECLQSTKKAASRGILQPNEAISSYGHDCPACQRPQRRQGSSQCWH